YEFSVVLPIFAEFTFLNGAGGYAALSAGMGIGSIAGGLFTASRRTSTPQMLVRAAACFGGAVLLTSLAPRLEIAVLTMVVVGFFSISFNSLGNVTLQLNAT